MRDVQIFRLEEAPRGSAFEMSMKELLHEVSRERKWPANEIIEGYIDSSVAWVVLDGDEVIGATKLVTGDSRDFPIRKLGAWPSLSLIDKPVVEAALLGVKQDSRGRGVFAALCSAIYWYMIEGNIPYVEAILDKRNLRMHREWGMRFQPLLENQGGGVKEYWGDPDVFPARLYVGSLLSNDRDSMGNLMIREQSDVWEVFLKYAPKYTTKGVARGKRQIKNSVSL